MHDGQQLAILGDPVRGEGEHVLEGPEHEGQRRAKLVTHVAEEGRLCTVQLGERFGPLALLAIRAHARDRGRHAIGDQIEEITIVAAERQVQAHADHEEAERLGTRDEREHDHALRRGGGRASGHEQVGARFGRASRAQRCGGRGVRSQVDLRRRHGLAREPGHVDQPRHASGFVAEVQQGERHVPGVLGQNGRGVNAHGLVRLEGRSGAELAERPEPPLAQNPAGRLAHDAEHAPHAARLVAHGVIGDVEVGLLGIPVSLEVEEVVARPEGLAGAHHAFEQRLEHVPDFAPTLPRWLSERGRVLGAEDRPIGVVVERDEVWTPEQDDLSLGGEQDAHRRAQALGPLGHGTQRRPRPVERAHAVAHLTATGEPLRGHWLRRRCRVRAHRLLSMRGRRTRPGASLLRRMLPNPARYERLGVRPCRSTRVSPPTAYDEIGAKSGTGAIGAVEGSLDTIQGERWTNACSRAI